MWLILLILIFSKKINLTIFLFYFSDKRPEQSIASARASVMIYDDLNKKWVPSGTSHGLSKVHIYHHFINNTFRVVGRKLQDHEVRTLSLNLSGVQQKISWRHLLFCILFCVFFAHFAHCQLFSISISCPANSNALCIIRYLW